MLQLFRNWVRKIVREEINRVRYPITDENIERTLNDLRNPITIGRAKKMQAEHVQIQRGEIIKPNFFNDRLDEEVLKGGEIKLGDLLDDDI